MTCECPLGFTGEHCEIDLGWTVDPCLCPTIFGDVSNSSNCLIEFVYDTNFSHCLETNLSLPENIYCHCGDYNMDGLITSLDEDLAGILIGLIFPNVTGTIKGFARVKSL